MSLLPFYLVPLSHPTWEEALDCARRLPSEAMPELRLDLFPDQDPEEMIRGLKRHCVVSTRRADEGGRWTGSEADRLAHLLSAVASKPAWIDLEWDLEIPALLLEHRSHIRLLRSVHVAPGVFDLEERLRALPPGEAFKWVGHAGTLADNARLKAPLAWARDHGIPLTAFLMGARGIVSRCLQAVWGGAFTYAAPEEGLAAAPGQLPLATLRAWRIHRLNRQHGLCGVLGSPVLRSRDPAFHNARFQANFKDLVHLPLEAGTAEEALAALDALPILGASLTVGLWETLPPLLGLQGPLDTLWRRAPGQPWRGAHTEALAQALVELPPGPVLLLGSGAVTQATLRVLRNQERTWLQASPLDPLSPREVAELGPVGVVQAAGLGEPSPFPELLEAARPTLRWALDWLAPEDTAFARWARELGLALVESGTEAQAATQSRCFIQGCGE